MWNTNPNMRNMTDRASCAAHVGMSPWDPPKATAMMDFPFAGELALGEAESCIQT